MPHPRRCLAVLAAGLVLSFAVQAQAAAAARARAAAPPAASPAPPAGGRVIKMTNMEKQAVTAVYASAPGKNDWGEDLLGKQTAAPGRTVSLTFMAPTPEACVQDLQLLMNDGKTVQKSAVNVCESADYPFRQ